MADDACAVAAADPFAVAAEATANGFVPIDAAIAPAPIALMASLRPTSTSECFACAMDDGLPFPVTCNGGRSPAWHVIVRQAVGSVTKNALSQRFATDAGLPGIVMYIGARS